MSLETRVSKLEAAGGGDDGTCTCTPPYIARVREADIADGWTPDAPPPCPKCGLLPFMVIHYDPDFYGNAERLEELQRQRRGETSPGDAASARNGR
jgi:hypothetical protein